MSGTTVAEVDGLTIDMNYLGNKRMRKKKITVRITNDKIGKSLSLCDELRGIMLEIPVEPVEDLLRKLVEQRW